jgi:hypothetical protein
MTILKIIELVGCSSEGLEEAVEAAVSEAAKTIRQIVGVDIVGWTAEVDEGEIVEWRANVKISFLVEEDREKKKGHHRTS